MATRRVSRVVRPRQQEPEDDIRGQINSRGQGGGGSSSTRRPNQPAEPRRPLGVPEDYTTLGQRDFTGASPRQAEAWALRGKGQGTPVSRGPRYFEGDEWRPANSGRDSIILKQQALIIAGYLDVDDEIAFGRWDETTADAYASLLAEANAAGLTADQMLQEAARSVRVNQDGGGGSGGGGGGGGRGVRIDPETGELVMMTDTFIPPPLEIRTANKADIERVFRSAVIDRMGVGLPASEISAMADAYIWKQVELQKQAYDQEVERLRQEFDYEGGGPAPTQQAITTIEAPSPETFIEDEMIRRDPEGYKAGRIVEDMIPTFMQAIQGWV